MRFFIPIVLLIAFIGWFFYRLLIRKDMRKHLDTLYGALFFFGVWAVLYWMMFPEHYKSPTGGQLA